MNFILSWRDFSWTGFALRLFSPVMILSAAWVLYNTASGSATSQLQSIGVSNYLGFIVAGNALFAFAFASAFVVGRRMYWERMNGTIESTFITPMSRLAYMSGIMLAASLNSLFDIAAVFAVGAGFGLRVASIDIPLPAETLGVFLFAMFGLGLVVNGITLTFRDRTTTSNSLTVLLLAFSGVVVPVQLMPGWAQEISLLSPLTYAVTAFRHSLGVSTAPIGADLWQLAGLGIVYLATGSIMLRAIESNLRKKALFSAF